MKQFLPILAAAAFAVVPLTAQECKGRDRDRPVVRNQRPKPDAKTEKQAEVFRGLTKQVELAVEVGLLDEAEANEILLKARKRIRSADKSASRTAREHFQRATLQLNELVKAGKVSREDAGKRLAQLRERLHAASKSEATDKKAADEVGSGDDWARKAMAETKKAHLSGEITAEEARSRVRMIMDRAAKQKEAKTGEVDAKTAKGAAISAEDYRRIHKRIKELVAEGRLTESEAKSILADLRERVR